MVRVQPERSARLKKTALILDATPLIYLCKSKLARHLPILTLNYKLYTTREVYREVYTKGLEKQVAEIEALKDLFQSGVVRLLPLNQEKTMPKVISKLVSLESSGIHTGEATIIRAAISLNGTAILDDKRAREVARSIGVNLAGTVNLLVEFVRLKAINKFKARDGIDRMIDEGWYCSTKDYIEMIKTIESTESI